MSSLFRSKLYITHQESRQEEDDVGDWRDGAVQPHVKECREAKGRDKSDPNLSALRQLPAIA